jgi:crotonobetainyl-CoA:carnitine CoA-transferase CaiB-like acyl-CoA transferase
VRPVDLTEDQLFAAADRALDQHELDTGLKAAGLEDRDGLAASLAAELTEHAREELAQRAQRARLADAGQPCYDLPLITDQMDLAGLYRLAAALRDQGAA